MTKYLEYGIEREMRIKGGWPTKWIKVFALAEDGETPWVIIRSYDYEGNLEAEISLGDVIATDVIAKIQKALDILPSSK